MTGNETDREIVMEKLKARRQEAYSDLCAVESNPGNRSDLVWSSQRAAAFARWQELSNIISSIEHSLICLDRLRARDAGKEQA